MPGRSITITLDEQAAEYLDRASAKRGEPVEDIVVAALREYRNAHPCMSDQERAEVLRLFDELVSAIPKRSDRDAQAEIDEIRAVRRLGGRRTPVE